MTEPTPKPTAVPDAVPSNTTPTISSNKYDALKHTVQLVLPAIGTLYFALSGIWGWPAAEKVVGSIAAANVFLGVIVTILSQIWKGSFDGDINIHEDAESGVKTFQLALNSDPEDLNTKNEVTFKVNKK